MTEKAASPVSTDKCPIRGCGHALSMHNSLGYCRSRTTPDRSGECICDSTGRDNTEPLRIPCDACGSMGRSRTGFGDWDECDECGGTGSTPDNTERPVS